MVTVAQRKFLETLESFWRQNLRAPSWRELTKLLGSVSTNTVACHIALLEKKGLVTRASTGEYRGSGMRGPERTLRTSRMGLGMAKSKEGIGMVVFWPGEGERAFGNVLDFCENSE